MTAPFHTVNPFPGLRAFRADEDYLFFGREEQTMDLLRRLGSSRFVAVVGTSGSGKSSLVRCGLLSELLGGKMLDAGASWEVAVTHPGGNPLALLTEALLEAELYDRGQEHAREQLLATLSRSHFGLVEAVKQAGLAEGTNFLLVVDQFEEIFRFHEAGQVQQEAANEFVSLLLEAATQRDVPIYIVLTMRSDFIGECGQFEGLAEMVNRGEFLIPRLTREQYKRIIEGPIKVAGGQIAPRLLQRLLNDIGQQQDQLPCLQHALMRTWTVWSETGDSKALDLDDYQRVGRMAEALSLHADEVYISLADDRQRELCRGMFQALTVQESEGRGIRRPQRLNSLCQILEVNRDELVSIIDAYRQPGVTFLMPSAEVELTDQTIIDISHESLMRVWTRLRHWVEEEAQAAGIYRRLSESATLYRQRKAGLYRDPELGIALAWREAQRPNRAWAERYAPGFVDAITFLEASRQAAEQEEQAREAARQHELEQAQKLAEFQQQRLEQQRRAARRLRATIAALAVVALLAVGACVSALMANANAKWLAEVANLQATAARENGERAGRALVATEEALAEVEREKKNAEQNLRKAEAAEVAARRAEDESRRLLYTTDLKLAPFVWKDEEATAEQLDALLARHDPANDKVAPSNDKEDLRGFEWYYFRHLIEDAARVFRGHDAAVIDCAVTPSGQLLTLDERWQLRRWDVETRAEDEAARVDLGQGRNVQTAALSPDGRFAAFGIEKAVHLFDTATGDDLLQIDSANVAIRRLTFSADGGWLVILDDRLRWCDTKDGRVVATIDHMFGTRCEGIALSPDGLTLVVAGTDGIGSRFSTFRLDAAAKKVSLVAKDKDSGRTINDAALSPDGSLVALVSKIGGSVMIHDASTGSPVAIRFSAHATNMTKVAFSANGSKLATSDVQGTIKIWDTPRKLDATTKAQVSLKGHSGAITRLRFLPGDQRLVSTSTDKTARIWDSQRGGAAIHPLASSSAAWARYSPDGLLIASAGDNLLRLWDAATGQLVRQIAVSDASNVTSVAFSPDNRLLAVGLGVNKATSYVAIWDIDSGQQLARLSGAADVAEIENGGVATALDFSPDGKYLVAAFGTHRFIHPSRAAWPLKVWEVSTRRLVRRLDGCLGRCTSVSFSSDGALLAAGSQGGAATLWSTETWQRVRTFENPEPHPGIGGYRGVSDVALSPDGKTLAMAGASIIFWNMTTGERSATLKGHAGVVNSLVFTPDGRTLASSGADETVRLWNVDTGRELLKLDYGGLKLGAVRRLAFSPDASRLLASNSHFLLSYGRAAFWSNSPPTWDEPGRAAAALKQLLDSGVDFQSRIRMLSENLRLHEALALLNSRARLVDNVAQPPSAGTEDSRGRLSHVADDGSGADDPRVLAALAATRANWHASQQRWPAAAEELERLKQLGFDDLRSWLRTPGLLRVARALVEQGKLADARTLLTGGAKRRIEDGAEVGLGVDFTAADGTVRVEEVVPGSPAARGRLRAGDMLLKINGFDTPTDPYTWVSWRPLDVKIGAKIGLTVRHAASNEPEDVVLTSRAFFAGEDDSLAELGAVIEERLAAAPASPALLELRALIAAQHSDSEAQVADCTAAIEALTRQSSATVAEDVKRLYRLRGDAYVALSNWSQAVADYARGLSDDATDEARSNWALAEAETRLDQSIQTIIPTSEKEGLPWRFTTAQPADDWNKAGFDDSKWQEGEAPFGTPSLPVRTLWSTPEIWLRHPFDGAPTANLKALFLRFWIDDTAEIFLNGQRLAGRDSWTQDYVFESLDTSWRDRFVPGSNTLAVHCRNLQGPGFFDIGLFAARASSGEVTKLFDARTNRNPWLMLALAYRLSKDPQGIDKLLKLHPQAAGEVGDLFTADDDWQRAVENYSTGLAVETNVDLLLKRARAYERLGEWDAAASDWRRAAEGNTDGANLLAEFAKRLAENGQSLMAADFSHQSRRILEDDLRADPANLAVAEALAKLLLDSNQASEWTVLKPVEAKSELGATFSILPDNSILAGGPNPVHDRYHVKLTVPADLDVAAVRLEALTDPSLPNNGPGRSAIGTFAQISWTVTASQPDGNPPVALQFDDAWADHQHSSFPINPNGHWNIYGGHGGNCTAVWSLADPVHLAAGTILSFEMQCHNSTDAGENLGHFRLSLSSDLHAIKKQKAFAMMTTGDPWARLAAAYAQHGELDQATQIAQRVLAEADTVAAKTKLLDVIAQADELLAALSKTRAGDLDVELALAKRRADRGTFHLVERRADAERDLTAARAVYARLHSEYPDPQWAVLKPSAMTSQGGATLTELDDGSLLAGGQNPAKEVYQIEARLDAGPLTAVRVEGLRHPSLPGGGISRGYDGHVMLTELEVEAASATDPDDWQSVKFVRAWSNDDRPENPVANAIDGVPSTPWGTSGNEKTDDRDAIFVAEQPFGHKAGTRLRIRLRHEVGANPQYGVNAQTFGRFRLSATGDERVLPAAVLRQADGDYRAALVALGKAFGQNGRSDESVRAFAEALELAKDRAAKTDVIASAAPLEGVLESLAVGAPNDAEIQAGLARYYAARGEPKLAAAARARFTELYEAALQSEQPETQNVVVAEALANALLDSLLDQELQRTAVRRISDPWMRLAAAYALSGERDRAVKLLRAKGEEPIATQLDGGGSLDAVIKLLAVDPELECLSLEIARRPEGAAAYLARGQYFARLGRWGESADDLLQVQKLDPQNRMPWLIAAPLLIMAGDDERYRQHCRGVLEQFRGTDAPTEADVVCKVCLLRTGMVDLGDLPVKRLNDATSDDTQAVFRPYFLGCCALASYREGNAREALAWADQLTDPASIPVATALVLTVRALAEHRLGRVDEARQTLARASALIPAELRTLGTADYRGPLPVAEQTISHDWLIPEILRREASALVEKNLP